MKKLIIITFGLIIVIFALWFFIFRARKDRNEGYEFVEIQRGEIVNTISSTGQLEPLSKVDVGTQVSGIIDKVFVDFNDNVKKGQILAILDTSILSLQCRDAQAALKKAESQLKLEEIEYQNAESLYANGYISRIEFQQKQANKAIAEASYISAQTALERAQKNLKYAIIRSPIDGKVINRNIEPGQTVAASLSAPTLFTIAEDLSRMRILAYVDESDIGLINNGLTVNFEVPAYANKKFTGKVVQIRLQPTVVSNVVNYIAVIEADNKDGLLMPGMTATIDFIIEEVHDVLMVSNAALSFRPTAAMMAEVRARMEKQRSKGEIAVFRDSGMSADSTEMPQKLEQSRQFSFRNMPNNVAMLWFFDKNGKIDMIPVKKGATDGKNTQVTALRGELYEGMKIIIKAPQEKQSSSQNPFMPSGPPGGRPGR